jgi:hypothetical protein
MSANMKTTGTEATETADGMKALIERVKEAFEAFVSGNRKLRDRAKAHGDALIRLRDECKAQGVKFTEVLAEIGVPTSTAYDHIKLSEAWDRVADEANTLGVTFEELSIKQIVNRIWSTTAKGDDATGQEPENVPPHGTTAVTGEKCSVRRKPSRADEAREASVKTYLKGVFGAEVKDVRVFFQRRNQEIKVALADDLVVIVPVK